MKVLKVEYNFGGGALICSGVDYLSEGATEEQRGERIRSEAADWVTEDVDSSDLYPVDVGVISDGQQFAAHARFESRDGLEDELLASLGKMADGQRLEVHDSDGGIFTVSYGEMTREECEALPEFDGW
jgi:hypothetical protein